MNVSVDYGPGNVETFRVLVAQRLGLQFDDSKLGELAELLDRRMSIAKAPRAAYLAGLGSRREELRILAHALTVHETYFFRNIDQFRAFSEFVLPDRARANSHMRRLRILSAGCASGEEPYSLAMLSSERPECSGWDVSIKGLDISTTMLDKAAQGRYSAWSLRETPAEMQTRYFRADGRDFVLDTTIRNRVSFEEHNLADPEMGGLEPEAFDVIFCRNVIMYFTPEAARRTVARIWRSLAPGGFLFLGHAETLRGLSQDFHLRQSHGTFYYQRRDSTASPSRWSESPGAGFTPAPLSSPLPDDAWVDIIRRASERIQLLTESPKAAAAERARHHASQREDHNLHPALELLHRERFTEATALLSALPVEAAVDPDVLLLRAVLLTHGGDLAAAEQLSLEVLAIDELNAGAHYVVALCRENARDREGAREHDEAALYLDPEFAMPRLHLGLLARRSGDRDRARYELQQALALLLREDAARVLMFGGGFNRDALVTLCRAELLSCGGQP